MWRDWPQQVCAATGRGGLMYSRQGYGQSDPVPDVRAEPAGAAAGCGPTTCTARPGRCCRRCCRPCRSTGRCC
jgi:hypothetical protein